MYGNYMTQPSMIMSGQYQTGNPYLDRLNAMQAAQMPQVNPYQITRVNGRNGAEAFQLPPNSSIMLLDESQPIVWLATTDGAGYKTCTPYQITQYQPQPEPDYNAFNERLTRLETMFDESHSANAKQQGSKPTGSTEPSSKSK